jgi:hypothetical protein
MTLGSKNGSRKGLHDLREQERAACPWGAGEGCVTLGSGRGLHDLREQDRAY